MSYQCKGRVSLRVGEHTVRDIHVTPLYQMYIGQIDMQSVQPHEKLTVSPRLVVMMHQTVIDRYASQLCIVPENLSWDFV